MNPQHFQILICQQINQGQYNKRNSVVYSRRSQPASDPECLVHCTEHNKSDSIANIKNNVFREVMPHFLDCNKITHEAAVHLTTLKKAAADGITSQKGSHINIHSHEDFISHIYITSCITQTRPCIFDRETF
jgi:hypothetical protein